MANIILKINSVDRSEYFVGPVRVNPGGDGVIGSATIYLRQEAGGLDIRTMDLVQLWVPFNTTTNAGIAAKGRLFGGHVMKRATTNVGTTKLWTLSCADFNVILKRSYRRASTVNAVTLVADTLDNQIQELFSVLQTPTSVQIDVVSGVALTTAMPAVSYPGGHKWEWYLQSLLRQAHIEDPAVFPAYYMAPGTTFGALDTFGPPMLNVYDAASPPASTVAFSDTPTGAEKSVFEYLTRDTDATALGQTQQSWYRGLVFSASDTASITAYPNIYDDSGTGWVDGEVINDTTSGSDAEALAAVEALVRAKGAPRDGFKWVTYERLIPGEYVDLKWDLEGIPSMTQYRVAAATFEWEEPNVIKTTLTINTRRLGLFDDGTTGFFAPPIEGDDVPPLPAADFTVASNVYNLTTFLTDVTFDIDNTGGSPDTAGYKIIGGPTSAEVQTFDVELDLSPTLSLRPGISYAFRVVAYDNNDNRSETFPEPGDPPLTFVTAVPNVTAPTGFQVDTGAAAPFVNGFNHINDYQAFAALEWTPTFSLPSYGWYDIRFWDTSDPTHKTTVTVPHNATTTNIGPLFVGLTYDAEIQPMLPHYPGAVAGLTAFTVPTWVGIAPVIGTVSHGISAGEYYLRVPLTHAGDHSGGGWINVSSVGGYERNHAIPRNVPWPYVGIVKGFVPEVLYTIEVYVFDAQMRRSPSDTDTYTIHAIPGSDKLHPGWDSYNPAYAEDERGLEDVDTDGTYVFDDTALYQGNSTLKLTLTNGTISVLLPEQIALQEGEQKAVSIALMGDSPATTGAVVQYIYFDNTDSEVGTRFDIYNDLALAAFPDPPIEKQTSTAPATVKYARILLEASDTSANSVWYSRPVVSAVVPSTGIKDGAVIGAHIAPTLTLTDQTISLTSTSKIEGGGGLASIDASGIKIQGDGSGDNNIDFYNEVGVKGGSISSAGSSGNFSLNVNAFYNGAGSTTLSLGSVDFFSVAVSGANTLFQITSSSTTIDTGSPTRPILLGQGSVVIGGALTDPVTDGYLYIPEIDVAPTGTPTSHPGTAAMCYVPGVQSLYIYDSVRSQWVSVGLL